MLLHTLVAMPGLPQGLPMLGTRALPARQDENVVGMSHYKFDSLLCLFKAVAAP
jgi:hypothetical protein